MLTIEEAFVEVIEFAKTLESGGVETLITPSKSESLGKGTNSLPREKWVRITFKPKVDKEAKAILDSVKALSLQGITFDMDGCPGERSWDIDWSFKVQAVPDKVFNAAANALDTHIRGCKT